MRISGLLLALVALSSGCKHELDPHTDLQRCLAASDPCRDPAAAIDRCSLVAEPACNLGPDTEQRAFAAAPWSDPCADMETRFACCGELTRALYSRCTVGEHGERRHIGLARRRDGAAARQTEAMLKELPRK